MIEEAITLDWMGAVAAFNVVLAPVTLCLLLVISIAARFGPAGIARGACIGLFAFLLLIAVEQLPSATIIRANSSAVFLLFGIACTYRLLDRMASLEAATDPRGSVFDAVFNSSPTLAATLSSCLIFATLADLVEAGFRPYDLRHWFGLVLSAVLLATLAAAIVTTNQARRCPPHYLDGCAAVLAFACASINLVSAIDRGLA
jgi:hypothetical protein